MSFPEAAVEDNRCVCVFLPLLCCTGFTCVNLLDQYSSSDELVRTGEPGEWSEQILHSLREDLVVHGFRVPCDGVCSGRSESVGR